MSELAPVRGEDRRGGDGSNAAPRRSRRAGGVLLLVVLTALMAAASLAVGARAIPPDRVTELLIAPDGGEESIILWSLRVPRTVLGVLLGMALGMAGALSQSHTRNPIADPTLLGVSYGAACAVVLSIYILGVTSLTGYVWFALLGAFVASVAVFAIASGGRRGPTPITLVLAGAAMTAFLNGVTSAVVLLDEQSLEVYRFWRIGSLTGRPSETILQVLPFLGAGAALALANAPALNILALGDDVATALGQRVRRARAIGVAAITLLTGAAVAAAGPIGFAGLMAPHLARALTGPDHRLLLPYAGLVGAVLLLLADVIGRVVGGTGEVEVGIILAVMGGPFFIALVRRRRLVAL